MYLCKSLTACVLVGLTGALALAQQGEKLPILDTFQGKVANDKKPELKTGFVATEAHWKEVWAKVNAKDKLPEVDFTKHFLLVSEQDPADPNRRKTSVVKDGKGVVTLSEASTLIGFQPSGETIFRFHKVAREGVTGVGRFDPAQKKMVVEPLPKANQPKGEDKKEPEGKAEVVPVVDQWKETNCAERAKQRLTIHKAEDFAKVWKIAYAGRDLAEKPPKVDFAKHMVLAVFMGERNSGGFAIAVAKVEKTGQDLRVHVKETSPGPNEAVDTVITHPFHIVVVRRVDGKVVFVEK